LLAQLDHKANLVDMDDQAFQANRDTQDSLDDHRQSAKRPWTSHASLALMDQTEIQDPLVQLATLDQLVSQVPQAKMVVLETQDLPDPPEIQDQADPMDHQVMLVNQDQVRQALQETKDPPVTLDPKEPQDPLADQVVMAATVNQVQRDLQDPLEIPARTVSQAKMAQPVHQVHKERKVSALNIVLLMVVCSLKMVIIDDKF